MYEYIKNENKNHDIFRANVISYMLNCHAENKRIRAFHMRQFCTAAKKNDGHRIQVYKAIAKILDRGLINRVSRGVYTVVKERAMVDELHDAKVNAGLEKIEVGGDQLLDYLNRDKPSCKNFRVNVLRHMINLHIQQVPIKIRSFNQFSACHQPSGTYNGVRYIFNTLLNAGAIEHGIKLGTYYVTDLNIVKKMLCDKEQSMSVPLSYPGFAIQLKVKQQTHHIRKKQKKVHIALRQDKPSPWFKPQPAWLGALDAVIGNLGR